MAIRGVQGFSCPHSAIESNLLVADVTKIAQAWFNGKGDLQNIDNFSMHLRKMDNFVKQSRECLFFTTSEASPDPFHPSCFEEAQPVCLKDFNKNPEEKNYRECVNALRNLQKVFLQSRIPGAYDKMQTMLDQIVCALSRNVTPMN